MPGPETGSYTPEDIQKAAEKKEAKKEPESLKTRAGVEALKKYKKGEISKEEFGKIIRKVFNEEVERSKKESA